METSNDCFVAALQKKLKEQGRGAKKKFAVNVGVSPNHLSDILAGRKNAGQKLKERIVDTLDMSFEEMLVFGRLVIEGRSDKRKDKIDRDHEKGAEHKIIDKDSYLAMAAEIIEGNSLYGHLLINNITAFHQAIKTLDKEEKALLMIRSLQKELHSMRLDIEGLKRSEGGEDSLDIATA